jgi:hypothetical protein
MIFRRAENDSLRLFHLLPQGKTSLGYCDSSSLPSQKINW